MILFKINSKTLSRNPTSIEQGKFKIQQSDRTINGTMVVDIIAIKNKVSFAWDYLTTTDLKKLIDEVNADTFPTIEYTGPDNATMKQIIGHADDISYTPHYDNRTGTILWREVRVAFIEK